MDNLFTESNNNQITSQSLHEFNSLLNIEINKSANLELQNNELELEVSNYKLLLFSKQNMISIFVHFTK